MFLQIILAKQYIELDIGSAKNLPKLNVRHELSTWEFFILKINLKIVHLIIKSPLHVQNSKFDQSHV